MRSREFSDRILLPGVLIRYIALAVVAGLLFPWGAHACQRSAVENAFDTVAPTATDIVAVQVQSLALVSDPGVPAGSGHAFQAEIRVLKHYRGSGRFTGIKYYSGYCAGLHLDVGGIYLIAANALGPIIELPVYEAPILHLSYGMRTFDPDVVLKLSSTVRQLEVALRGDGTFQITTEATRRGLSPDDPVVPPVPPPEPPDQ